MKLLLLSVFIFSSSAYAIDSAKCSKMLNDGLYKKYEWGGMGDYNLNAMTKESKKNGYTTASSNISTEGSTAALDPVYTSNVSTSQTQSTSSTGDCSLFALQERANQRDLYIAQNYDQIKKDIAKGSGEHLDALAWFSLCEDDAKNTFNHELQKNFENLFVNIDKTSLSKDIDKVIAGDAVTKSKCYILSSTK